jgi:hypothetical protein
MCAVGIIASQTLWVIDFLSNLIGHRLTGLTDYMFMSDHLLFLRGLSLFHGWLPFLLLYLVWRLGYDGRALPAWTVVAWGLVLISFFLMPPPRPDPGLTPVNIDYVWGFSDTEAQALDATGYLGGRIDDPVAGLALRAGALPPAPPYAETRMVSAAALRRYPLLAQSGHPDVVNHGPLTG